MGRVFFHSGISIEVHSIRRYPDVVILVNRVFPLRTNYQMWVNTYHWRRLVEYTSRGYHLDYHRRRQGLHLLQEGYHVSHR